MLNANGRAVFSSHRDAQYKLGEIVITLLGSYYRIVPRSYAPNDDANIKMTVDNGLIRPVNLEPADVNGILESFKYFLKDVPFIPAGLDDAETAFLHPEKIDGKLYPILEQYAKGGVKGDWLELPSDLVRGYMFFLSTQVAKRRQLERCTDDEMSFAVGGYFSEDANFTEVLYDRESSGFYSSLLFNDLLPINVEDIPMEKIIKVSQDTRDERAEFRNELNRFTTSLCDCESRDHAETVINDYKQDLLAAKKRLKASQGFLGEHDCGSLFTMGIPVALTAYGSIVGAGADPFSLHTLSPSVFIGAIAAYADYRKAVSSEKNPYGTGYLLSLERRFSGTGKFPALDRYMEEFVND
jgi:hypothetical protein